MIKVTRLDGRVVYANPKTIRSIHELAPCGRGNAVVYFSDKDWVEVQEEASWVNEQTLSAPGRTDIALLAALILSGMIETAVATDDLEAAVKSSLYIAGRLVEAANA
jgi:uncharacterized protein YlzI (FlbEa/FlbD family)